MPGWVPDINSVERPCQLNSDQRCVLRLRIKWNILFGRHHREAIRVWKLHFMKRVDFSFGITTIHLAQQSSVYPCLFVCFPTEAKVGDSQ